MKCPKCQFENREGTKFCKECGVNLELVCSECGTGLNQLTSESSAELISAILKSDEVVHELKQLIYDRAAGNPLFMEEFSHNMLENGLIEKNDNQFVLSPTFAAIQVPETIQGIIAARMDRLEENLKRTMQVASVIGRDFAFRILQSTTGMREELKYYLLDLQGLEFIYEKQLFPELEYIFKHALTQEVAYNSLLLKKRKKLHEIIGRVIEKIYTARLYLGELYSTLESKKEANENLQQAQLMCQEMGNDYWLPKIRQIMAKL